MWCVPVAVAALIDVPRERVWLDILAERYERGRRLTNVAGRINEPHGGLHAAEALRSLARFGFEATDLWQGTRRLDPAEVAEIADKDSIVHNGTRWLILQQGHMAHLRYCPEVPSARPSSSLLPLFPVAKMWRIEPALIVKVRRSLASVGESRTRSSGA